MWAMVALGACGTTEKMAKIATINISGSILANFAT
jgi:hypothetical protein